MKRFLVALVVAAALVVVAAFQVPSDAATVNGASISQQSLDANLSAIAGSSGFQCYLGVGLELAQENTSGLFPVYGAGASESDPTTYNTAFVRYWLTQMLSDELVAQVVTARHLAVTPADLVLGRESLVQQITAVFSDYQSEAGRSCGTTGSALLASLPAGFRSDEIEVQAERDVLLAHEAGYGLDTTSLERYFTTHRRKFDTVCISYVLFPSKSDATTALGKIAAGTPIAGTGTLTSIGCAMRSAITSLPSSVTDLAPGKVSAPLSAGTATGKYALLEVTSQRSTTFAAARTGVVQALLTAGSAKAGAVLEVANRRAHVTADPRYGRVKPRSVAIGSPAGPPKALVPDPEANLPLAQESTSSSSTPSAPAG